MTPLAALRESESLGLPLRTPDGSRLVAPGDAVEALPAELREALHSHREQIAAALALRDIHRAWGMDEDSVRMVEEALLEGRVNEVVIVPAPAGARVA